MSHYERDQSGDRGYTADTGRHPDHFEDARNTLETDMPRVILPLQNTDIEGRMLALPVKEDPDNDAIPKHHGIERTEVGSTEKVEDGVVWHRTTPMHHLFARIDNKGFRRAENAYTEEYVRVVRDEPAARKQWNDTLRSVVDATTSQSLGQALTRLKSVVRGISIPFEGAVSSKDIRSTVEGLYKKISGKEHRLVEKALRGKLPITETLGSLGLALGSADHAWRQELRDGAAHITSEAVYTGVDEGKNWVADRLEREKQDHIAYLQQKRSEMDQQGIGILESEEDAQVLGYFGDAYALRLALGEGNYKILSVDYVTDLLSEVNRQANGSGPISQREVDYLIGQVVQFADMQFGIQDPGILNRMRGYLRAHVSLTDERIEESPYFDWHRTDLDSEYAHESADEIQANNEYVRDLEAADGSTAWNRIQQDAQGDTYVADLARSIQRAIQQEARHMSTNGNSGDIVRPLADVYNAVIRDAESGKFKKGPERELRLAIGDAVGPLTQRYLAHAILCPGGLMNGLKMNGGEYTFLTSAQEYYSEPELPRDRSTGDTPLTWRLIPKSALNVLEHIGDITKTEVHEEQEYVTEDIAAQMDTLLADQREFWKKRIHAHPGIYAMVANDATASALRYVRDDAGRKIGDVSEATRMRALHAWEMALEQAFTMQELGTNAIQSAGEQELLNALDVESGARTASAIAQSLAREARGPLAEELMDVLVNKVEKLQSLSSQQKGDTLLRAEVLGIVKALRYQNVEPSVRMSESIRGLIDTVWDGSFVDVSTMAINYDQGTSVYFHQLGEMILLADDVRNVSHSGKPEDREKLIAGSRQAIATGKLRDLFNRLFPFTQANDAMQRKASQREAEGASIPIRRGRTGHAIAEQRQAEAQQKLRMSILDVDNDELAMGAQDYAKMWRAFLTVVQEWNRRMELGAEIETDPLQGGITAITVDNLLPSLPSGNGSQNGLTNGQRQLASSRYK